MNAPALPASAADYIAHIDLAFELMVVLDASGRIVRANAAARRPRAERCDHNVTSGHALKWCSLGAPLMKTWLCQQICYARWVRRSAILPATMIINDRATPDSTA